MSLIFSLIILILVVYLLNYLITMLSLPDPVRVCLLVLVALFAIGNLFGYVGTPLVVFPR